MLCSAVSCPCFPPTTANEHLALEVPWHAVCSHQLDVVHCWQDIGRLYLFALVIQCFILIPYMIKAPEHKQTTAQVAWRLVDLVTFAAPPGLPLVLLVLGIVACSRLKKLGMVLLFPEIVKRGAAVDVLCVDKTGTLTDSAVSVVFCISQDGQDQSCLTGIRPCFKALS